MPRFQNTARRAKLNKERCARGRERRRHAAQEHEGDFASQGTAPPVPYAPVLAQGNSRSHSAMDWQAHPVRQQERNNNATNYACHSAIQTSHLQITSQNTAYLQSQHNHTQRAQAPGISNSRVAAPHNWGLPPPPIHNAFGYRPFHTPMPVHYHHPYARPPYQGQGIALTDGTRQQINLRQAKPTQPQGNNAYNCTNTNASRPPPMPVHYHHPYARPPYQGQGIALTDETRQQRNLRQAKPTQPQGNNAYNCTNTNASRLPACEAGIPKRVIQQPDGNPMYPSMLRGARHDGQHHSMSHGRCYNQTRPIPETQDTLNDADNNSYLPFKGQRTFSTSILTRSESRREKAVETAINKRTPSGRKPTLPPKIFCENDIATSKRKRNISIDSDQKNSVLPRPKRCQTNGKMAGQLAIVKTTFKQYKHPTNVEKNVPSHTKKKAAKPGPPALEQDFIAITKKMEMPTNKVSKETLPRGCNVIKQNGVQACALSTGRRAILSAHIQQEAMAEYFAKQLDRRKGNACENKALRRTCNNTTSHSRPSIKQKALQNDDELGKVISNIVADIDLGDHVSASKKPPTPTTLKRKLCPETSKLTMPSPNNKRKKEMPLGKSKGKNIFGIGNNNNTTQKVPLTRSRKVRMQLYTKYRRSTEKYRKFEQASRKITNYFKKADPPCKMQKLIQNFRKSVLKGPEYVCISCNRMLYRYTVRPVAPVLALKTKISELCTNPIGEQQVSDWICHTCHSHITKGKVPPMAIANGMGFPKRPSKMHLHQLEWRLLAPRLVFMKIHQAPRGKQFKIEGNVINVISLMANAVNMLPRKPSDAETIPVKLKRRLKYSHHAMSQNIRPNMVRWAAKWLVKNGPLFKEEGIEYDNHTFITTIDKELEEYNTTSPLQKECAKDHTRYRCLIDDCTAVMPNHCGALAHISSAHNGHVPGEEKSHGSRDKPFNIIGQQAFADAVIYNYYCSLCNLDYLDEIHPKDHMFTEHGLLNFENAISYHTRQDQACTIHTYKLYDSSDVATFVRHKQVPCPFPVWAIELKSLNITDLKNMRKKHVDRIVGEWTKKKLPSNPALSSFLGEHNKRKRQARKTREIMRKSQGKFG